MIAASSNSDLHSYENKALMDKHIATTPVQNLIKGISGGLVKDSKIIYTDYKAEVGFSSRL